MAIMHEIAEPMPGPYAEELAVMEEMPGWTYADVMNAPADLVEVILWRRHCRLKWTAVRREMDEADAAANRRN